MMGIQLMKEIMDSNHHPRDARFVANWYNQRYRQGHEQSFGRPPAESRQRLAKLPPIQNQKLLDVACGQGYFLDAVHHAGGHAVGVDIAEEAIAIARQISPDSHLVTTSGQALPFPGQFFDVLTCWGALEHHPDVTLALREFGRVTKPGGVIFLRVPNRAFWIYTIKQKLGLEVGTEQQDVIEHLFTLDEWRSLLQEAGLDVIDVTADNWFLQERFNLSAGLKATFKLALRKLALAAAPLRYTYTFDFLCRTAR